ncbi:MULTISPECIES: cupin domain-containing protein [unclassified Bacillus (in: firmicutes)]|uniref:cupin domain-containing protein n=1 Tax=Bacillaceae TaxID=186817 RepID=UPI000BF0ED94|nr:MULTISPECIES: cupin domain-containing protein [unclassified Bacillus (in: firmicutes)]PEJ58995.1 cupin [Bacillus sp. AFS002410]PEK98981.1 cupin [Bacillus sp. AFS017336]QKE72228.1 cupin domain-containing protein [Arthrobacter citreus]
MLLVNTDKLTTDNVPFVSLKTIFNENSIEGGKTQFGTVLVPPKARIPISGFGSHNQDEYSIVIKGSIYTESAGESFHLTAGDATLIPAGEEHWAINDSDEDCEIVWVLVER